jgi:hypothetical protein
MDWMDRRNGSFGIQYRTHWVDRFDRIYWINRSYRYDWAHWTDWTHWLDWLDWNSGNSYKYRCNGCDGS